MIKFLTGVPTPLIVVVGTMAVMRKYKWISGTKLDVIVPSSVDVGDNYPFCWW